MTKQLEQFVQDILSEGFSSEDILKALESKEKELQSADK